MPGLGVQGPTGTSGQECIPFWEVRTEGSLGRGGTASKTGSQRPGRANLHPSRGENWDHF